uniref:Uncharacterized protein n=1 Tax=Oryza rufipogon TaxID=4529 RepID=A0A0E0R8K7_ORYRU
MGGRQALVLVGAGETNAGSFVVLFQFQPGTGGLEDAGEDYAQDPRHACRRRGALEHQGGIYQAAAQGAQGACIWRRGCGGGV